MSWKTTDAFNAFLSDLIRESDFAPQMAEYYPCIMWSLGGTLTKDGILIERLPARYDVTLIERSHLDRFIAIPSEAFGFIGFKSRDGDESSTRRLIDFNGKDIVVR